MNNPVSAWHRPLAVLLTIGTLVTSSDLTAQRSQRWVVPAEQVELGRGPDELFQSVQFGQILPDGRAVVADAGLLVLRVYGLDGSAEVEMGGEGAGPGEFRSIDGLWVTSAGRLGVWDATQQRVTFFDLGGHLVNTRRVLAEGGKLPSGNLEVFFGSFSNDDLVLASLRFGERQSPDQVVPDRWMLARFGNDGAPRALLGGLSGLWRTRRAPVPFSPVPRVAVRSDSLWIAHAYKPKITVRSGRGSGARTIEVTDLRLLSNRDEASARSLLEAELRRRQNSFFLELLEQAPRTTRFPAIAGLLIDEDQGQIWIKAYDPALDAIWLRDNAMHMGPGGDWQVLTSTGAPVGSVRLPREYTLLDVCGRKLLAVSKDALDVERVVILEVPR